ncbi:uncharacterized protein LOC113227820 [Hyposmocoma kahamanoa]|uniref:uncharacterized protein LOC113227820 n=1 Tax=Hyposmocoma kahamanoa TaxID=1477025 RepID=UPI000E6D6A33|nr:uncharacterized protein LOC113227820 [Hyposmocoma kahamanoa]
MAAAVSTPMNSVNRDNLTVLIRNNVMNESVDFTNYDSDMMETDSPVSKRNLQVVSKKLFHSPLASPLAKNHEQSDGNLAKDRSKKSRKRKQILLPSSCEKIKKVYIKECDGDGYSPEARGGMRKKMLISLFHNKEYSMDMSF